MRDPPTELFEEDALMDSRELGVWGEKKAAAYLKLHGYRVVDTNFSCRQGEIDIIAENGEYIAFVEVKLRKSSDHGEAREFVTYSKQRRIITAAQLYLQRHETEKQPRFDVLELYWHEGVLGPKARINHIENAFEV